MLDHAHRNNGDSDGATRKPACSDAPRLESLSALHTPAHSSLLTPLPRAATAPQGLDDAAKEAIVAELTKKDQQAYSRAFFVKMVDMLLAKGCSLNRHVEIPFRKAVKAANGTA